MRFRVQFLDRSANIIREMHCFAWSVAYVIELLMTIDWPLAAVNLRILDQEGKQVHFHGISTVETGSVQIRPLAPLSSL
jgi:hypothetical protein